MNQRGAKLGYEWDFATGDKGNPALAPAMRTAVRAMNAFAGLGKKQ